MFRALLCINLLQQFLLIVAAFHLPLRLLALLVHPICFICALVILQLGLVIVFLILSFIFTLTDLLLQLVIEHLSRLRFLNFPQKVILEVLLLFFGTLSIQVDQSQLIFL